jgi:formate hydrogenlyase maturation protein HycH
MSETVVFSQLSRKFIDENDATPDQAQQVVYYSLAIGHHLGVIDCLEAALSCPWQAYLAWIATLEEGSTAAQNGRRAEVRRDCYRQQSCDDAGQRL